ncbi:LmeA family phospholipid-binding protein [Corynebacterium kutscheri]|uniref:LmeA family phospholipid-binding protein n=1 Tax=Corynebacterium kutscheri TaxID=35755 RepID=UPI001E352A4C|nr:DUF2993 domain-containing protein [Corynebacterium kutscheri]
MRAAYLHGYQWYKEEVKTSSRRLIGVVLTLATIIGIFFVTDTVLATRSEQRMSQRILEFNHLTVTPSVYYAGFPFVWTLAKEEISTLTVGVSDISLQGFGSVRFSTVATKVTATKEQILAGDFDNTHAQLIAHNLGIDAVGLGQQLGVTDLLISNPYDISPSSPNASEVCLEATPQGFTHPVAVFATLRLVGPMLKISPYEVVANPNQISEEKILDAFRWEYDTRALPLGKQASFVYLSGGTIFLQSQERNITLKNSDFAPTKPQYN